MGVVADQVIVFSGQGIRREYDACKISLHEFLNDYADAFAGYIFLRFVALNSRILSGGRDPVNCISYFRDPKIR